MCSGCIYFFSVLGFLLWCTSLYLHLRNSNLTVISIFFCILLSFAQVCHYMFVITAVQTKVGIEIPLYEIRIIHRSAVDMSPILPIYVAGA